MAKFNVNESEKNRIRGLHKNHSVIKEQDVNVGVEPIGVDPAPPGGPTGPFEPFTPSDPVSGNPTLQADDGKTKGTPSPSAPSNVPCQTVYNQVQSTNALPYWNNAVANGMIPGICSKCNTHYQQWVSMGSPMPVPQGTDWYQYGAAGQQTCLLLINNPQCCTTQTTEHECINGQCVQQNGGQFPDLTTCQQNCSQVTNYCVDCQQQIMSTYQAPQTSCPQGFVDIGTNPNPSPGPCIECQNGNCVSSGNNGWAGPYNTTSDCQQQCQSNYECVNNSCVPDPNGQYPSLAACTPNCGQNSFDCTDWTSPSGCQSVGGSGGQFQTLDDCLVSPCQCDDVISVWPLYTNNPNIGSGSGTWYGSPHDGPSNTNAIQNQLNNLQGNPNFPGGNPTQQHKMKCREAAMQFWLSNSANYACCSESMWGANPVANGGNGDTLGCVSQQWISIMNNFVTNSPNWPSQGCPWLNNALANVTTQQQNFQPGSAGYCKTQGKIDFINNFKQTGTSTYVNGSASFPIPCV